MSIFSVKDFMRQTAYNIMRKRVDEKAIEWTELCVSKSDIIYFCLSSNPIISIKQSDKLCFFRECIELLPKKEFLLRRIDYFFIFIHNNDFIQMGFEQKLPIQTNFDESTVEAFKKYINNLCSDKHFVRKMLRMDMTLRKMGYSIWSDQERLSLETVRELGLTDLDARHLDIAVYFIWQMRSAACLRRNSKFVRGKRHSYFNAVRTMSTQTVAHKLGLFGLVPESKWCRLRIGDIEMRGVLSAAAQGGRACDCEITPTVALQQRLTELHMLDIICFQQDHGPNNYNLFFQGKNVLVCAFDNDNANTFFPMGRVDMSLAGCESFIGRDGQIKRNCFDKETADRLMQTDVNELCGQLEPYLNFGQRYALKIRIAKIKKSLKQAQAKNILISKDEWSDDILADELSGEYGATYLTKLFQK